jgi:hypothetical protein
MAAVEQLKFTCRRLRRCREKLPADLLYRDEASGELYCKAGHCPQGQGDTQEALTQLQIENRRLREQTRSQATDHDRLLTKVESLQEQLATALEIRDIEQPAPLAASATGSRSETVPLLLCSDWHCGAVVDPSTVCGLNRYDVDIFHERAVALFRNTLRVVRMLRSTTEVSKCVIWLGGDLIDNWLHPDQIETQVLSPTQQLIECERAIVAGFDHLLEHGDFEQIIVPCSFGNHGRTTEKMRAGNAAATSYEWLMYQSLRRHYRHLQHQRREHPLRRRARPQAALPPWRRDSVWRWCRRHHHPAAEVGLPAGPGHPRGSQFLRALPPTDDGSELVGERQPDRCHALRHETGLCAGAPAAAAPLH